MDKQGSWYSFGDQKLAQGKEGTRQFLKDHPEIAQKIDQMIRENGDLVSEVTVVSPE